jgi:hypothetical protein
MSKLWQVWWDQEGSAIQPNANEDIEEFARRITQIAWENGAFCAKQPSDWVGLTDEDKEFIELTGGKSDVLLAELVEIKLKEKNT